MDKKQLALLGWNTYFENQLRPSDQGFLIGRVAVENKTNFLVIVGEETYVAEATGKLFFMATADSELPKVGDWVLMAPMDERKAIIQKVLERKTVISRKVAGKKVEEQVIASNVDKIFIVQGLDGNFNLARLERYLTLARNIDAVIVLNKADLCPDRDAIVRQVKDRIKNVPVVVSTALENDVEALWPYLKEGETIAVVGSSGVGKSTIINKLTGQELMTTGDVRKVDSKGKHTTTGRHLIALPNGGLLIDTPGMRELQLWGDETALSDSFADIEELVRACKFKNCTHTVEKGCAVNSALENGSLNESQWFNYIKMKKELNYLERKQDLGAAAIEKNKWKKIHKHQRDLYKSRNK